MLSATYEDGKTIEYTYDNSGRTATISDEASGTVSSFGYDYMDRVSVYTQDRGRFSVLTSKDAEPSPVL